MHVFKIFPLSSNKFAQSAAMSAGRQEEFWEFHDKLLRNRRLEGFQAAIGKKLPKISSGANR